MDITTTYSGAMDICLQRNMRLCSTKEICRDGKTPYGGVINGNHFVPVSDNYNHWIQIGKMKLGSRYHTF